MKIVLEVWENGKALKKLPLFENSCRFLALAGDYMLKRMDDDALLREYLTQKSGKAFAELVNRHANPVDSTALRIDEPRMWSRALSQKEVAFLFQSDSGPAAVAAAIN